MDKKVSMIWPCLWLFFIWVMLFSMRRENEQFHKDWRATTQPAATTQPFELPTLPTLEVIQCEQ